MSKGVAFICHAGGSIVRQLALSLAACVGACHSDAYIIPRAPTDGPFRLGPDIPLSFNVDQDYWPIWTEDARGILYAFVDPARPQHRCIGLLPSTGGTRIWQLCDNRATRTDSLSSYVSFALDSTGRLLLTEALGHTEPATPPVNTLWLTDSARPFVRTRLITFPVTVAGYVITTMADLQWTGPNTFIGMAQQDVSLPHCVRIIVGNQLATQCLTRDSLYAPGPVVRGTITGTSVAFVTVAGTDSATGYAFANGGASIVFTAGNSLYSVPAAGGVPTLVLHAPLGLLGVGCKGANCIYSANAGYLFSDDDSTPRGVMQLRRVSLVTGVDQELDSNRVHLVYATPQVSPINGDLVVQVGGGWGHLQTYSTIGIGHHIENVANGALHLYRGAVP